ncbi:hypothetical protein [Lentzea atacamensis]|uniref:hypothetical protein n=1 Tax=Lentzea atacamensis TaxID=531938 RepID=UPI00398993C1
MRSELGLGDDVVVDVEGASLAEGTDDEFSDAVRALVAQRQQHDDAEAVERFRAELDRDGLAVEGGLVSVTDALCQANVDTLFVDAGVLVGQLVWTSGQPEQVSVEEADVRQLATGSAEVRRNRADEALARAAAVTGAYVVGDGLTLLQGVGALLRHRPDNTPLGEPASRRPSQRRFSRIRSCPPPRRRGSRGTTCT